MKRIISIALTAVLMCTSLVLPATAATWVTVSSWAYNDVSNFKKEGLLPESFEDISDYTQDITRMQFAELIYSVLIKTKLTTGYADYIYFDDTDSKAANTLRAMTIVEGEMLLAIEKESGAAIRNNFYGERLITREEMASMLYRTANEVCNLYFDDSSSDIADWDDISDWARESVSKMLSSGMLSGMEDGRFAPKSNLTIEQAITAVYRLYNNIPINPGADGANIKSNEEITVQSYSNGITETKKGNILYLRNNSGVLMEFETDIYSNIYCETVDGVIYAVVQNCYGKTDVYNAETKEMLFKMPYPVASVDRDYINVKSSIIGPMTFGLYSYSGKEILEPKYSMEEIEILKDNNFKMPEEEYRAADGWIYYIDENDGYRMYKIDSNGENKQKLSDNNCYGNDFEYMNGWLYYNANGDDRLYTMKADGTHEQCLTDDKTELLKPTRSTLYISEYSGGCDMRCEQGKPYRDGEWVYYVEGHYDNWAIWRVSMSDEGAKKEKISGDICVYPSNTDTIQLNDGILYFIDFKKWVESEGDSTDLYRYDGNSLTRINGDLPITDFGFYGDKLIMRVEGDDDEHLTYDDGMTVYIADLDGSNPQIMQETEEAKKKYRENVNKLLENPNMDRLYDEWKYVNEELSDERFTVYHVHEWKDDSVQSMICVKDNSGNESVVKGTEDNWDSGLTRIGDTLYYQNENSIWAYDMNACEAKELVSGVDSFRTHLNSDDWFTYTDYSLNYWRYNISTGETAEIFPNSGFKRYGKPSKIAIENNAMYKVDTDGNYSLIMDNFRGYCLYVENGQSEGTHFN